MESRIETYLNAAISGNTENLPQPISRVDYLLCDLIKTINESTENINKMVTEKVAEIVADAPEDLDTLKEISDWITTHKDSAAAMNADILANADAINTLTTTVETLSTEVNDSIKTPATAMVGQILSVKSVDENGKPMEWETVDSSSGNETRAPFSKYYKFSTMDEYQTIDVNVEGAMYKDNLKIIPVYILYGKCQVISGDYSYIWNAWGGRILINLSRNDASFAIKIENGNSDLVLVTVGTGTYDPDTKTINLMLSSEYLVDIRTAVEFLI